MCRSRRGGGGQGHGRVTAGDDEPDRSDPPAPRSPRTADTPTYVLIGPVSPRARTEEREAARALMAITRKTLDGTGFRGGIDVRVSLRDDAGEGTSSFDGAWWPRTRDLAREVPELIAELERRGVKVERFTYALDSWTPAPRKLVVLGRVVRTGGFRSMDPQVVCLSWAGGNRRADLLVVPPETDVVTGSRALRLCTRRGLPRSPQMVMAAARATPIPQVPALPAARAV